MRELRFAAIAVCLALAAYLAYAQGGRDQLEKIIASGVLDTPPSTGGNVAPSALFTIAIDSTTTPGQTVYTFDNASTDTDGTVDTLTWFINGNQVKGATAAVDTLQRTLGPATHTVALIAKDDGGVASFATQSFQRRDMRFVDASHNQASLKVPPIEFPLLSIWSGPDHIDDTQINLASDFTDTAVVAAAELYAQADMIQHDGSRYLTPIGTVFQDSVLAQDANTLTVAYLRFNHAPTDLDLASGDLATAQANAGPIVYYADTVWQDFPAYTVDDSLAAIFDDGAGGAAYYHANHWASQTSEDGVFDRRIVTEYADSLATHINNYADDPLDAIIVDYISYAPNVFDVATGTYGGDIDYRNNAIAEYDNGSWSDTAVRDAYFKWQLEHVKMLDADYPNTALILNGNFLARQAAIDNYPAWVDSFRAYVDGVNFEGMGIVSGSGLDGDPLSRLLIAGELYDDLGYRWNKFGTWPSTGTVNANGGMQTDEITRVTAIYAMLGGGAIDLQYSGYDTRAELRAANAVLADLSAGEVVGDLIVLADTPSAGKTTLRRQFEGGVAEAIFESDGYPAYTGVTPNRDFSDAVRFIRASDLVVADFTATSSDNLTYTFTSTATSDYVDINTYFWLLGDIGLTEYNTSTFEHTFAAGSDSLEVFHYVTGDLGAYDSVQKYIQIADPEPTNVAPTAVIASVTVPADSLAYNFSAAGSSDSDGTIITYLWDFGDNTTDSGSSVSHTYAAVGGFRTVQLIVEDNDGATDTTTVSVPIAAPVAGVPTIASITGTVSDGESITIIGTGFGTKPTAAPAKFDDFENGINGAELSTVDSSWNIYGSGSSPGAKFSSAQSISGGLSVSNTIFDFNDASFETNWFETAPTDTMYVSFWYVETGDGKATRKTARIGATPEVGASDSNPYGGTGMHTVAPFSDWASSPCCGLVTFLDEDPTNTNGGYPINSTTPDYNYGTTHDFAPTDLTTWRRHDMMVALSSTGQYDGRFYYRVVGDLGANREAAEKAGLSIDYVDFNVMRNRIVESSFQINTVLLGLMVANSEGGDFVQFSDDVYIDTTWARVEIGDDPDYASANLLEMQIPTAWAASGDTVTVDVNLNMFAESDTAYVFVIDKDDTRSVGYPVVIGSGSAPALAAALSDSTQETLKRIFLDGGASGGTAPYTYAWSRVSGGTGTFTSTNTDTTSFTADDYSTATTLRLTVTDDASDTDTVDVVFTSGADPLAAPAITFTGSPVSGDAPLTVDFDANNTGGAVSTWAWRFGDNSTGSTEDPSHEYSSAGTYSVTLVATNAAGADSLTRTDYITAATPNSAPTISAFTVSQGDSLTTIELGPITVSDSDGTVDSLRFTPWSGSYTRGIAYTGTAADTVRVDYTSQQTGTEQTLTATVAAVDDDGATDTDTASVIVKPTAGGSSAYNDSLVATAVAYGLLDAESEWEPYSPFSGNSVEDAGTEFQGAANDENFIMYADSTLYDTTNGQWSEIEISTYGSYMGPGILFNNSGSGGAFVFTARSTTGWTLYRMSGRNFNDEASGSFDSSLTSGDTMRIEYDGTDITMYHNDVLVGTWTHDAGPTTGTPGVYLFLESRRFDVWRTGTDPTDRP